jgi:hypothetical protein
MNVKMTGDQNPTQIAREILDELSVPHHRLNRLSERLRALLQYVWAEGASDSDKGGENPYRLREGASREPNVSDELANQVLRNALLGADEEDPFPELNDPRG